MNDLLNFLKSQKVLILASHDAGETWITNLYFSVDDDFKIYFVSPEINKHSGHILNNPNVAFSVVWFNPDNYQDRKAVQGQGTCRPANSEQETARGVQLHNKNFPVFSGKITLDWIQDNEWNSRVWVIEPSYMKFWNDELHKEKESEEFTFPVSDLI